MKVRTLCIAATAWSTWPTPELGLANWWRAVRLDGHLIVTVPDEDLYEQGTFPSTFNREHKWTFTIFKSRSWSPRSRNVVSMIQGLGASAELVKLELLNATYRYALPRYDQTLTPVGESGIEFVVRKRTQDEVDYGGRPPRRTAVQSREMRLHLNQYRDDQATLRSANRDKPPFENDADI